jgi:hypothetical protein
VLSNQILTTRTGIKLDLTTTIPGDLLGIMLSLIPTDLSTGDIPTAIRISLVMPTRSTMGTTATVIHTTMATAADTDTIHTAVTMVAIHMWYMRGEDRDRMRRGTPAIAVREIRAMAGM